MTRILTTEHTQVPPGGRSPSQVVCDRLSHFRTRHTFRHFAAFRTVEEFCQLVHWARAHDLNTLILANGSNVFFSRSSIRTCVLKNELPPELVELGPDRLQASSTVSLGQVLRWCEQRNLDSFYYLASVPATVGGAVAMNAGRGRAHRQTVFDYVESVSYVENCKEYTVSKEDLQVDYRQTPFTGLHARLITQVVFKFPPGKNGGGEAKDRVLWSKKHQDHSAPNCGSVFKSCDLRIMKLLRGLHVGKASFSRRTSNWILNRSTSPWAIRILIGTAQMLHRLKLRKAVLEIIRVK